MYRIVRNQTREFINYNGIVFPFCLPVNGICRPCTDTFYSECGEQYNCIKCQTQGAFYMPWVEGDLIYFQTQFVDYAGAISRDWGDFIKVTLCTNLADTTDHTLFSSDYFVGVTDDGEEYQNIIIDTSTAPFSGVSCWGLLIEVYDDADPDNLIDSICTEPFQKVNCENTSLISSKFVESDCCYNYYGDYADYSGTGVFKYKNDWRFHAELFYTGSRVDRKITGKGVRSISSDIYTLNSLKPHAPFALRHLRTILGGHNVKVNGEDYKLESFSYTGSNVKSYKIPFLKECENINC